MQRFKNFVATGLAPNGRLYADDLDELQDLVAALEDFTQTIKLGTVQIGDSSIGLLKYGAAEARLTAALRVDGILRGLGGLLGGTFTTTQRNAIPSGFAPTGLIIYNSTTARYEWNAGTDVSRNWKPLDSSTDWSSLLPTANEKAALAGTGSPSGSNKYVTADTLAASFPGFTGAAVYSTVDQSVAHGGGEITVLFDAEEFDTNGFHSTSSNTGRLTVPSGMAGVYEIDAYLPLGSNVSAPGNFAPSLRLNGTDRLRAGTDGNTADAAPAGVPRKMANLRVGAIVLQDGNYVEVLCANTHASADGTVGGQGGGDPPAYGARFSWRRLADVP